MNEREKYLQKLALAGKLISPMTEADLSAGLWSFFKDKMAGGTYKLPWAVVYVQTQDKKEAEQVFRALFDRDPFEVSCCNDCGPDYSWGCLDFIAFPSWNKKGLCVKSVDFAGIFEAADAVILQDILEANPVTPDYLGLNTSNTNSGSWAQAFKDLSLLAQNTPVVIVSQPPKNHDLDLDADANVKLIDTTSWVSTVLDQEFKKEMSVWKETVLAALAVPAEMLGEPNPFNKYSLKGLDFETAPENYIKAKKYIKGPSYTLKADDDVDKEKP